MTRRLAKINLLSEDSSSMMYEWTDVILLRRERNGTFSVHASQYGEDPDTGRRGWLGTEKTEGLNSPMKIWSAVEDAADFLSVYLEWEDVIPQIAKIDWLSAAVIAAKTEKEVPELPDVDVLLSQRSLRKLGRVTLGARRGDRTFQLVMPFERWCRIIKGLGHRTREHYWYDGVRFGGSWTFAGNGGLEIAFGDGGENWSGPLADLHVIDGPKVDGVDLAKLALRAVNEAPSDSDE